jgi:hypothetical protein
MLVHHTKCGLPRADEAAFRAEIASDAGRPPPYGLGAFDDLDDACAAIARAYATTRFSRTGTEEFPKTAADRVKKLPRP